MIWLVATRQAASRLAGRPAHAMNPRERMVLSAWGRANAHAASILASRITLPRAVAAAGGTARVQRLRQILLMPVGDSCNLACRYCYEAGRREAHAAGAMSLDTLRRILANVLPHVRAPFAIGWHGGEPLLRGHDFFARAFAMVRETAGGGWVDQIIQTNASLLDDAGVALLREHRVIVSLSLDGPPAVHDAIRVMHDGRGSHDLVLRGIDALRRRGVPFSTIAVISAGHAALPEAARSFFDYFRRIGITAYDVHPSCSPTPSAQPHNLSPAAYAGFMTELFDRWLEHGDPGIAINFFDHVLQGMTGQRSVACYLSGRCTSILGVGADGRTIPCTRPFDGEHVFGNLAEQSLPEIVEGAAFRKFEANEIAGRALTQPCAWAGVCGGGCPHERVRDGRQAVEGRNVYCTCATDGVGGYPAIFAHIKARIEAVLGDAEGAAS